MAECQNVTGRNVHRTPWWQPRSPSVYESKSATSDPLQRRECPRVCLRPIVSCYGRSRRWPGSWRCAGPDVHFAELIRDQSGTDRSSLQLGTSRTMGSKREQVNGNRCNAPDAALSTVNGPNKVRETRGPRHPCLLMHKRQSGPPHSDILLRQLLVLVPPIKRPDHSPPVPS